MLAPVPTRNSSGYSCAFTAGCAEPAPFSMHLRFPSDVREAPVNSTGKRRSRPMPDETPDATEPAQSAEAVANEALNAAQDAVARLSPPGVQHGSGAAGAEPFNLPSFTQPEDAAEVPTGMDLLSDVNLNVKIELGRTRMLVEDVLRLGEGSVVELDKLAGDPVDIYVNDRAVARGEVLVLNDNFCVRISEILTVASDIS
jgi:flagellar motor switch protein FliN/FliY